jgi:hypothetical protein
MAIHGSIIAATKYSSVTHVIHGFAAQYFFKHTYLTMPTLTPFDALVRAADNLTNTIAGIIPPPNITTDAIGQLINIFKLQAKKEKDTATAQRVLKERA